MVAKTEEGRQLPLLAAASKLEAEFWAFHETHPRVYVLLVAFARQWRAKRGPTAEIGAKALWERVRWEANLEGVEGEEFKINNDFTSFYSRLIMSQEPELRGIFRTRRQTYQATIGPEA